ncbi:MAG: zinc-dependent metalloprotease [Deltaproteobacteria bacterium]|nr:zinc-dependent metalloprotease [Deltaproteobacteria bacterium]
MRFNALLLALTTLMVSISTPGQAQPQPLYQIQQTVAARSAASVEESQILIQAQQINGLTTQLTLPLLDGTVRTAQLDHFESRGMNDFTWRGWLTGNDYERVVLTRQGSAVSGLIFASEGLHSISPLPPSGKSSYSLSHSLARIDASLAPSCGLPTSTLGGEAAGESISPVLDAGLGEGQEGIITIDTMALYTPQAFSGAGGTIQMNVLLQSAIDVANTAFRDAQSQVRFSLVHAELTNRNDGDDGGTADQHFAWLGSDPYVGALRDTVGADLVALISESVMTPGGQGVAGYAQLPPDATGDQSQVFSVNNRRLLVDLMTLAHEHGHNLGFQHDPANSDPGSPPAYPFAHGHFISGSFRTLMAVEPCVPADSQCRVPLLSTPHVTVNGIPAGIVNQRDNGRAADLIGPVIAQYRNGMGGSPVGVLDPPGCETLSGWARDPDSTSPIRVDIEHDGVILESLLASDFRSDIPYPDQDHAFSTPTAAAFRTGNIETVRAFARDIDSAGQETGTRIELNLSPNSLECPLAGPFLAGTYSDAIVPGIRFLFHSTSEDPTPFTFSYDETKGAFHQRQGGACLPNLNNDTYLTIHYGGPNIQSCSYRASWDQMEHTCSGPLITLLNQHTEFILNTDLHNTDSQNRCNFTSTFHLQPAPSIGWFRLTLTTVDGEPFVRKVNFIKR